MPTRVAGARTEHVSTQQSSVEVRLRLLSCRERALPLFPPHAGVLMRDRALRGRPLSPCSRPCANGCARKSPARISSELSPCCWCARRPAVPVRKSAMERHDGACANQCEYLRGGGGTQASWQQAGAASTADDLSAAAAAARPRHSSRTLATSLSAIRARRAPQSSAAARWSLEAPAREARGEWEPRVIGGHPPNT